MIVLVTDRLEIFRYSKLAEYIGDEGVDPAGQRRHLVQQCAFEVVTEPGLQKRLWSNLNFQLI